MADKKKFLFPLSPKDNKLPELLSRLIQIIGRKTRDEDSARLSAGASQENYERLLAKHSVFPGDGRDSVDVLEEVVEDLFSMTPRWRSPNLQYNVGTAVNSAALAAYTIAMEQNIYAINDGLAGDALIAEDAVTNILSDLARIQTRPRGFFTFGGTATNLYAIKLGLKRSLPMSSRYGVSENVKVMVTEDAHFSHKVSIDWLGIGTNNMVVIEPNLSRRSNLDDAEAKMREILSSGNVLTSISINGGTTYGHVIDDISGFVNLRDRMVVEFSLDYSPHLHVDSVIGWAWLLFNGYDYSLNPLNIGERALEVIREQNRRISQLKLADSWGIDFHKGIGACPVDCSMFVVNDEKVLQYLSKRGNVDMHHLAQEFSFTSPVDYTLETSRSAGPMLAALVSLKTLGLKGYRSNLANLVELSLLTRDLFSEFADVQVANREDALGYVTMLRFYPPELINDSRKYAEINNPTAETLPFSEYVNEYMMRFFKWDKITRMDKGQEVEYSFSSAYIVLSNGAKLSGAKLYPVSPHFNELYARQSVETIMRQKRIFDTEIWNKE